VLVVGEAVRKEEKEEDGNSWKVVLVQEAMMIAVTQ